MKKTFLILGAFLALVVISSGCQQQTKNTGVKTPPSSNESTPPPGAPVNTADQTDTAQAVGLANPASTNCTQKGGTIEMRTNKNGEYGVCLFADNQQCEEWALYRGQCPEGGVKITGYENEAEIYCAITGGQVEGVDTPVPMCKRVDGTYCNAQSNLDGECPDPNNPNPNAGNTEAP